MRRIDSSTSSGTPFIGALKTDLLMTSAQRIDIRQNIQTLPPPLNKDTVSSNSRASGPGCRAAEMSEFDMK